MKKIICLITAILMLSGCFKEEEPKVDEVVYSIGSNYNFGYAIYDGFVVYNNSNGKNLAKIREFYLNSKKDIDGVLTTVMYTIEGDPIVYEYHYKDGQYTLFIDNTRDEFAAVEDRKITKKEIDDIEIIKDNYDHDYLQEKVKNPEFTISIKEKKNCQNEKELYYTDETERKYYIYCISTITVDFSTLSRVNIPLKEALADNNITMAELISKLKRIDSLNDGGTVIYRDDSEKGNLTVIKCNTLMGNKAINIGNKQLEHAEEMCK